MLLDRVNKYKRCSFLQYRTGWQSLRTRRLNHKLIQLFKITHQISPPYLQSLLPAAVENRYNTRNSTNNSLPVIYAKLSSTRNSFVPSSIKAWNNLPVGIRGATSFYIFKSCIVNMNKKVDMFHPNLYRFYISRASVHHCRLRLGLSALNSQRFQYGFISNMSCDSCNYAREDVRHYIFFCPAFAAQRQALIEGLIALLPTAVIHCWIFCYTVQIIFLKIQILIYFLFYKLT